ncbi:MAG: GreA/GreB family elongation factor [Burkholderiaceae bacterium]|jgi:regulator of nucleoside diphosphate kinase|uniref:GreA/GreB family elongation factor n=1 Tax=Hydrogenophaga sp. TaxID=1904254 RepID=UPI00273143DD|nr:GreA/GreB family elongation factor [Hydrogenophaga sp.]MDP2164329.1 GreA/GreB family elongation factor [Hydrogenophaga sp.]MDP3425708.1 GreA/GreB family elongation factor [Burkholderiaceae bacterium]
MHKPHDGERLLTEIDFARLNNLHSGQLPPELVDTLDSLDLVPSREIPPDIVTMYSQVMVEDLASRKRQKLTLCYPIDAEPHQGFISVLSPVGASLLGQRVGAIARWRTPNGDECAAEIATLLFQPEASGDYTT